MHFKYSQAEYNDGDVYLPAKEVGFTVDNEIQDGIDEVLDSFKEFLVACGYLRETVDRIVFKSVYEPMYESVGEVN